MMLSDFVRMLLVDAIHFEDRFCASKKVGYREVGGHAQDIVAALAGCRTASAGTGWTMSHHVSTNGCRNHSSSLVEAPILGL